MPGPRHNKILKGAGVFPSTKTPRSPFKMIQKAAKKAKKRYDEIEEQRKQEKRNLVLKQYTKAREEFLVKAGAKEKRERGEFTTPPIKDKDGNVRFDRPDRYQPRRYSSKLPSIREIFDDIPVVVSEDDEPGTPRSLDTTEITYTSSSDSDSAWA